MTRYRSRWVLAALALTVLGCRPSPSASTTHPNASHAAKQPVPPVAARRPHAVRSPHGDRDDPYYWLRDDRREAEPVLAYLRAENAYAEAALAPARADEEAIYAEQRARLKEDDATVPELEDGYWYYRRYEVGKQQPIYARKKGTLSAPEEVLLDGNRLAEGHAFYRIGDYRVSRDGRYLAWVDDTLGRNQYALHVKDLQTGTLLPDTAENLYPSLAWANDHATLFYVGQDEVTLRPDRVFRHLRGGAHELVLREEDGEYSVAVGDTKSRRYVAITLVSTTASETRLIDADVPARAPEVFLPRAPDHLYDVDHLDGRFVMRTNADAKNFRLVEIRPGKAADRRSWKTLVAHDREALIEDFALYHTFTGLSVRRGGLRRIDVLPKRGARYELKAPETPSAMSLIDTPEPASTRLRYDYDSLITPRSVFEVDLLTQTTKLLKEQPVPTYDKTQYETAYVHAPQDDGVRIPISLVYRRDTPRDGSAPLLIYGYGAYGFSIEPSFDASVVSLLDRGFVYAIAHIRGGEELGRAWYEDGKLMKKQNTFSDFVAATEHLVRERIAAKEQVFAMGRSAGGLLMGAIANQRPDLYRGIITFVPFVDAVTTMLDESIPLTTNEFDEWGNPKEKAAYDYMLRYSPYDNVGPRAYPSIFVHTGLHDAAVQYFEPAKWVAKLRYEKQDQNLLVLVTDMTSGHGGASGRFDRLRQTARALAFILHVRRQPDRR